MSMMEIPILVSSKKSSMIFCSLSSSMMSLSTMGASILMAFSCTGTGPVPMVRVSFFEPLDTAMH